MEVYNKFTSHEEFKYHCKQCEFQALEQDILKDLVKAFHEFKFSCCKCHESFTQEELLTDHLQTAQRAEKFLCSHCEFQTDF